MRGDEFFELVAKEPPFSKMHPQVAAFFKDYLSNEKVISFHDRSVLNTHFPPYPSRAFDNFAEQFSQIGEVSKRRLFSVTLAVTITINFSRSSIKRSEVMAWLISVNAFIYPSYVCSALSISP